MKEKKRSSRVCDCRLKLEESILSPKSNYIDHVAMVDQQIIACGRGKLFQRIRGSWGNGFYGDGIFKAVNAGTPQNVSVHGNRAVLLTGSDKYAGQLYVYESEHQIREVAISLAGPTSTVLLGARDKQEIFFVTDHLEKVVHLLSKNGELIRSFGAGILRYPYSLALDPVGDVIVSDWLLNDVIIFAPDGSIKRRLGSKNGFTTAKPFNPYGIAVDEDGYVFVSSWRENKIFLFSPNGDLDQTLMTEADDLDGPTNLAVANGRLILVNSHGTQIRCYRYRISERRDDKK